MSIHPTAIVDPRAEIDPAAEIGPGVVIEGKVKIAAGTKVLAHAFITSNTTIGPDNIIHPFAVLGNVPQDLSYGGEESYLKIGKGNTFREGCSVHRGSKEGSATIIGDSNLLMGYSHIAHDCVVGNRVIMANGALVAGHVHIEDQVFISGNASIHQFVRMGRLSMLGGMARAVKDVPPYMLVGDGDDVIRAINVVALRRAGFGPEVRKKIKRAYKILYRSGLNVSQALEVMEKEELGPEVAHLIEFIRGSKRGICKHA